MYISVHLNSLCSFTDVDLGASWIHGACSAHPTSKLVNKYKIDTVELKSKKVSAWSEETGESISKFTLLKNGYKDIKVISYT